MFTVTGSPTQAFIDALRLALIADATLMALVIGVFGNLSEAQRTVYPYLVLGRRSRQNDGGAMQIAGGHVSVQFDVWSAHKGASEAHAILSRVAALLERRSLRVSGYAVIAGSLTCEMEEVFDEPDADKPGARLYHGVQRWTADIEEAA
jgi:Protein of unknown function (DUF3168)